MILDGDSAKQTSDCIPRGEPMQPIMTTLAAIRSRHPCITGWTKLLAHLGKTSADDEPLSLLTVLDSNGLDDALWCLRVRPDLSGLWRLYAVDCARQVQHLMADARSIAALDVAERHAREVATDGDLAVAENGAWAARVAIWTTSGCRDAAWAATAAAWAVTAAVCPAIDASFWAAASGANHFWQSVRLRQYLSGDIAL